MVEMNRVGQEDFSRMSQKLAGFLKEHGAKESAMQQRAAAIQNLAAGDIMLSTDAVARVEQDSNAARSAWTWSWPF